MDRIQREKATLSAMMRIYCRAHHGPRSPLCDDCVELETYAHCRLDRCPFGVDKSTCADCPIHCYRKEMRDRVKTVMRYAGPRMIFRHPLMAVRHVLDGRRSKSPPTERNPGK